MAYLQVRRPRAIIARAGADSHAIARWEGEGGRPVARKAGSQSLVRTFQPRIRSVLVATDLSSSSDRALGRIPLLPLPDGARVTLLHVVPGGLTQARQRAVMRDANRALAEDARQLQRSLSGKIRVRTMVKAGAIAKEIGRAAGEVTAELIVMGRDGRRRLREAFLGSTAERVIRQSRLPVLLVRLPARAPYRRPALALDLDQSAYDIIRLMFRIIPPPRPRATVIHAYDYPYGGPTYPSLSHGDADELKEEAEREAKEELARVLAMALARLKASPEEAPFWKAHLQYGSPRQVVQSVVRRTGSDLLVLGTRGHAGATYGFLGSVAGDLLRAVRCDVLVVPPSSSRRTTAS